MIRRALVLLLAALVAPDESGADHLIRFVEQDEAVHLAGEADSGDVRVRYAG